MVVFHSSDNKRIVRGSWNLPIIKARRKALGKGLSYLGMPGPDIEDLLDWQNYLDRIRTGVELDRSGTMGSIDRDNQTRILRNVLAQGEQFSSGFELRKGHIEDLIIGGVDRDGVKPQLGDGYVDGSFTYDLINLDFCGGIGYKDKTGHSRRVKALRKLAEKQQNTNFILLLTLNVRDKMEGEIVEYLRSSKDRYRKDLILATQLDWYARQAAGKQAYKLKAAVPLFIQQEFEVFGFKVFIYPPLTYEGTGEGSRLVNFMFDARHKSGSNLPVFSEQNPGDLIRLPMMEVVNRNIKIAEIQHPDFDFSICESCLAFLDREARKRILAVKRKT